MNVFSIVAGTASIVSLFVSILAIKGVHDVKIQIGFKDKSRKKVTQKASGQNIRQSGGDINA